MANQQNIRTHILQKDEAHVFESLITLFNEVFEEYKTVASKEHLLKLLNKSDFVAIVALQNGRVVGGLTAYEMSKYYNDRSELYIYDIAVKSDVQGGGIGKMLLRELESYAKENNVELVFVEAHSEDIDAVKFYESTFGKSEKVDHFNYQIQL